MHKKVSLREIVANKIVYALMLTSYYWMWARSDWKDWYMTAQTVLGCILAVFFLIQIIRSKKYRQESVDEMAEQNLKRCDSFCLKLFVAGMAVLAFVCALIGHGDTMNAGLIGWIIVLSILVLSVIRTVLFCVLDSKGV